MCGKRRWLTGLAAALALTCLSWAPARAGVFVNIGVPLPIYGPNYHHHYYGPRVYVAAPPVVVGSAPVYVAPPPATVYVPAYQTVPAPVPVPPPPPVVNPGA
jgi:hypothetical protein